MSNGSRVFPVYGERALTIGKALVVADLHIGKEHVLSKQGVMIPSQTRVIEEKLVYLIEKCGVGELIILGDFKHNIPSTSMHEYKEIP
jgi:metallophosphoesterase superfamily enzyme